MSEPSVAALARLVAEAVQQVPGVVRLEPTLSTGGPQGLYRRGPTDGVRVARRREQLDVEVNIAVSAAYQARSVAEEVERHVQQRLGQRASVTVNVLTLEDGLTGN